MFPALLCLCVAAGSPDDEDLARFPSFHVAAEQLKRYRTHRVWLMGQRGLYGWSGGRYEVWLAETDLAITFWYTLWDCRWTGASPLLLRRLIGPERYLDGWHPPLIPDPPPPPREVQSAAGSICAR
jgi:hypothetical protein